MVSDEVPRRRNVLRINVADINIWLLVPRKGARGVDFLGKWGLNRKDRHISID